MRPADTWKDYELLDATDGNRLERWGETILIRPDPQVVWKTPRQSPLWAKADAVYHRSNQGGGEWEYRRRLPEKWKISCGEGEEKLTLIVSPTGFKHTGVFPEQAVNWAWYQEKIKAAGRPIRVLNLFGYTGGATLACLAAGASVTHVDTGANLGATVHYTCEGQDGEQSVWGEIALVAIGRDPITDPAWGVTIDDHGHVATDAYGRTDKPGVWAVGDVTAGHALAHRAFEQGIVIAETIAGLNPKPVDEATVPQIVFSFPEAASVGLTVEQAQAREDLIEIKETNYPMLANARMLMSGTAGSLTIVSGCDAANPDTPRVLGVHMVSQMASDIIAEAEQLVGNHVPLADAARLVHPHPTFSETLGEALLKADGRPLHTR